MNIFFLDESPAQAVKYHHDVHVNKMLIETGQMMSTAIWCLDPNFAEDFYPNIYLPTHYNHPSTKWVRDTKENYLWTQDLFYMLFSEFCRRFGKIQHLTHTKLINVFPKFDRRIDSVKFIESGMEHPLCMPDEYKTSDYIESYRNFYRETKMISISGRALDSWTTRGRPEWL